MALFKCKMCGGDLCLVEGVSVAECEYCGTQQTVPAADDEKKLTLFGRANRLRMGCEFDKAAGVYESIVADFPEEAEAYWGLVLCKYGIEYVDDPATGKKVPTCHRSSFDSVMDDADLEQALENADPMARRLYREEAKAMEELRRGIIEVSGKEEPYDIFICYKETDDKGERTIDSVIAQDVYEALTDKGYRVFFSRITLEDKLGREYEPYIFAALNSAKVMLAFGTDYEYYNAVWVKNEWSRFLKLMAADKEKYLIPCYKGIDAYDIPKEFAKLQAQDMGKVGAVQDLLRGIEKLLSKRAQQFAHTETVVQQESNHNVASLLKRVFIFLRDEDWQNADKYCEKVLDIDPENARAYLGKLMVEFRVKEQADLGKGELPIDQSNNYKKILLYADEEFGCEIRKHAAARTETKKQRIKKALELVQAFAERERAQQRTQERTQRKQDLAPKREEIEIIISNFTQKLLSVNEELASIDADALLRERKELTLKVAELKEQKDYLAGRLSEHMNQQARLGLFAITQKKQLSERIAADIAEKGRVEAELNTTKDRLTDCEGQYNRYRLFTAQKENFIGVLNEKKDELESIKLELSADEDAGVFSGDDCDISHDDFTRQCFFLAKEKLWEQVSPDVLGFAEVQYLSVPKEKTGAAEQSISEIKALLTDVQMELLEDGSIVLFYTKQESGRCAKSMLEGSLFGINVGNVHYGKVSRIIQFGAFVELAPGKEGLVHISKLANHRVEKVEDIVVVGDIIPVKVTEIDDRGRMNLNYKDAVEIKSLQS